MFEKLFFKKINSLGLSVFRIFYSIVLFCEVFQLFSFNEIIYETSEINVDFIFIFWFPIIIMLILGLFTRFATILNYVFSVIIFSSAEAFEYHVFYAYVGINLLLIFLPLSRSISLDSLFKKLKYSTLNYRYEENKDVFAINYLFPVFVAIGLVYLDSIFFKLTSKMWMKGLGMWLPANLPMAAWNDFTLLMNNEFLVKSLGYTVLVFEIIFVFCFWVKRFRVPFLIFGISLHLGIALVFPLPWFGLTVIGVYLLMIPVGFWSKFFNVFKSKKRGLKFYYDEECPLCNKIIIAIDHFDVLNRVECLGVQKSSKLNPSLSNIPLDDLLINIHSVDLKDRVYVGYETYIQLLKHMIWSWPFGFVLSLPGVKYLGQGLYRKIAGNRLTERCTEENCSIPIISIPLKEDDNILIKGLNKSSILKKFWISFFLITIFFQFIVSWRSALIEQTVEKLELNYSRPDQLIRFIGDKLNPISLKYLGITNHPVFMDEHFQGYNKIIKVIGIDKDGISEILPIIDNNGMPFKNISGAFWVNYTFRTSSQNFSTNLYEKGIIPYMNYYEKFQNSGKEKLKFEFFVKKIEIPKEWKKNFLREQMAKPWVKVGQYSTFDDKFSWIE